MDSHEAAAKKHDRNDQFSIFWCHLMNQSNDKERLTFSYFASATDRQQLQRRTTMTLDWHLDCFARQGIIDYLQKETRAVASGSRMARVVEWATDFHFLRENLKNATLDLACQHFNHHAHDMM